MIKTTSVAMETVIPVIRPKEDEPSSVLCSRPELGRVGAWRREKDNKTVRRRPHRPVSNLP